VAKSHSQNLRKMAVKNDNKPIETHVLFNTRNKKWMLSVGLVQGIVNKFQIEIYDDRSSKVGIAQITEINPTNSQIEIIEGNLDTNEAYIAHITEYQNNSLKLYFKENENELNILRKNIEDHFDEFLIQEAKDYNSADFIISIVKSNYIITFPNNNRSVILPLPITDNNSLETLKRIIWDLSKWNYVKKLNSFDTTIPKNKIEIQIYRVENEGTFESNILLEPSDEKIFLNKSDKIRIAIKNNDDKNNFFCSLLGMGTSFDISSDFLEERVVNIKPTQQLHVWKGDMIHLEDVFLEHHTKDNWKEIEIYFKLIVTIEDFDSYVFESFGIPVPYSDLESYNLIRIIRRRTFFAPEYWMTSSITIVIRNPNYIEKNEGVSNY